MREIGKGPLFSSGGKEIQSLWKSVQTNKLANELKWATM